MLQKYAVRKIVLVGRPPKRDRVGDGMEKEWSNRADSGELIDGRFRSLANSSSIQTRKVGEGCFLAIGSVQRDLKCRTSLH
uniref:Uncharacterized protein n=1 Tax=Setaria digitata TaxID=48799 RepID=A0A915PJL9_9BILA